MLRQDLGMTHDPFHAAPRLRWTVRSGIEQGERNAAEETPVALVHDGVTTAVMMATPTDIEDFAVGFSLTEGIIDTVQDIRDIEIVGNKDGIEARIWLARAKSLQMAARQRRLAGSTGCGLCGVDSLSEALKPPREIGRSDLSLSADELLQAIQALETAQFLGKMTRAVHAAALWRDGAITAAREDVGRHNALDKLAGAVSQRREDVARSVLLLTSRVSVEMIQKAAVLGAPVLCAVSAPTALAIRMAQSVQLTLVAVTRSDGFELFTCPERITFPDGR
jgi:FdhD protein